MEKRQFFTQTDEAVGMELTQSSYAESEEDLDSKITATQFKPAQLKSSIVC